MTKKIELQEAEDGKELLSTLGQEYFDKAMALIERCRAEERPFPLIGIPFFTALVLAENVVIEDDGEGPDGIAGIFRTARHNVLTGLKVLLDSPDPSDVFYNSQPIPNDLIAG